jgi:hypothetical protein
MECPISPNQYRSAAASGEVTTNKTVTGLGWRGQADVCKTFNRILLMVTKVEDDERHR